MLTRKFPKCGCVSILAAISVPTLLGTTVTLVTKIPDIIKTANAVKSGIEAAAKMADELDKQFQEKEDEVVIEV